ncbi:MAG: hypothetical protein WC752_01675 [Patescibacteria group bacterium]|jgi:hypothetical protein
MNCPRHRSVVTPVDHTCHCHDGEVRQLCHNYHCRRLKCPRALPGRQRHKDVPHHKPRNITEKTMKLLDRVFKNFLD